MKKWKLLYSKETKNLDQQKILNILLENREIKSKTKKEQFLNPKLSQITVKNANLDPKSLQKAIARIKKAIAKKQKIIVFGDYDVDGVCGTAIIWETLNDLKANALPFIPSRFEEGYGLSIKGIDSVLRENPDTKLIITVDNGIVANEAVDYAVKKGIDVIITDHHIQSQKLPKAYAIVHTTSLCGTGVGYFLSKTLKEESFEKKDKHLELVLLATIADLVPLTNSNRILVFYGLKALRQTTRPGLLALFKNAALDTNNIDTFEISHIIAPRINAMGRLLSAMDSLRLICTTSKIRAADLANVLSSTNISRQELTNETLNHARNKAKKNLKNLIFIADESYQQGIIGLVAGRLVEEFYLPSIVISKGREFSKASARSVKGFNIIEFLRKANDLLVDVGGHPMAAGFTVETKKLEALEKRLYKIAGKLLKKEHLQRSLRVDTKLPVDFIKDSLYLEIQKLAPFGMGNPEPTFLTDNLIVNNLRLIGNDGKHLKLQFKNLNSNSIIEGIAFGMGEDASIKEKSAVSIVYTLEMNEWNGYKKLQLKIKDLKKN